MRRLTALAGAAAAILVLASAWAETTHAWRQSSYAEFRRGQAENIAISSDGKLALAPALEEIYEAPSSYLWDLAADAQGNVFVAAGPEAKVFRIGADRRKSVLFETEGVEIHAVAVDADGNVYAATSPESRIYKIDPSGASALFYDPRAAYVWDMVFDAVGDLYVATGDEGRIHRVKPNGDGEVFYETGETHVRSLAFDGQGRLIAGGDPGGLILRIEPGAEPTGFVLFQSSRKEITALVAAEDGTVYAAGVGLRTAPAPAQQAPSPAQPGAPGGAAGAAPQPLQSPPPAAFVTQVRGGSSIVAIAPGGEPREIWSDDAAIVYALALDGEGRLVIGTGERGRVFRLDGEDRFTLLTTLVSSQATALHRTGDGAILIAASNIGKVYRMGPGLAPAGTFESETEDAERFAHWGRVEWSGEPAGGTIEVAARSGNLNRPPRFWSDWGEEAASPDGAASELPGARYAQWRAVLERGEGEPPVLDSVMLYYRPANAAPRITRIELVEPNYRFPPRRGGGGGIRTLSLPPLGTAAPRRAAAQAGPQTLAFSQAFQSARWSSDDDNGDSLRYLVEIRGEGESVWIELDKDLDDAEISFDSSAFADGIYRLRVTAVDAASNPVGEALTGARVSDPFLVDNTAPALTGLEAERDGPRLKVRFRAADAATKIAGAEISLNGGEWRTVLPQNGLFDSREAAFELDLEAQPAGEVVVAARVRDEHENLTAAKTLVTR
jgi:outer membrane protein assembly factor BamB